jgi:CTP:molybdopterin cytidylyltransferase MocA
LIAGVLLAAGASKRMGRDKALVRERGESFLVHGVRHLWTACDSVVVVLGSNAAAIRRAAEREFEQLVGNGGLDHDLRLAERHGARGLDAHFVVNHGWRQGMLSSARLGIASAIALDPAAVLLLPVDHPKVAAVTVASVARVLLEALAACRPRDRAAFSYALIPRHRGRRGHPVAMTPALARAVAGDKSADDLSDAIRRHARLVGYLDVGDAGILVNRNSPRR